MKPLLAAIFTLALSSPAWAIGCALEPSPINCTGHFLPVGQGYQLPAYQQLPTWQPPPRQSHPYLPSLAPPSTTRCVVRYNGYDGNVVVCQ